MPEGKVLIRVADARRVAPGLEPRRHLSSESDLGSARSNDENVRSAAARELADLPRVGRAELIPDPDDWATMATTLPAPPEKVRRWLAQMGGDRGGWYSRDWLDNNGEPSADRIVPEWQSLEKGEQLSRASVPGTQGPGWFTVEVLAPNPTLVLRSTYGLFSGRSFDPRSGPAPRPWVDGSGASICDPDPGAGPVWWRVRGTEAAHGR